jgi:hypothetical protein
VAASSAPSRLRRHVRGTTSIIWSDPSRVM